MLSFLSELLTAVEDFPRMVLGGVLAFINTLLDSVGVLVNALFALLPGMPALPTLGGGEWLGWLNWLMPIGEITTAIASLVAMYVAYLAVRYALNLVRAM